MSEAIEALVGQRFGNYRLVCLLGQGGFASVYLGENIHISTLAAVKVLHAQIEQSGIARFRAEARTVAGLKHPHIVQLIDFGVEGTVPYFVMNYAPNGHLRKQHPAGKAVPLDVVVSHVNQIADALQFAHDHKVIHRDVKPENILLGEKNELQLSDFGIAFIVQTSHQQSVKDVTGTLAYMAPEQAQGKPGPASDQYALGIVTYELLTGMPPFQGNFAELLAQHFSAPPPSLRTKLPALPPAVEQVIFRALEKNPQERFPTISSFSAALEQASKEQAPSLMSQQQFRFQPTSKPLPAAENTIQPEHVQDSSYDTFYQSKPETTDASLTPVQPFATMPSSALYNMPNSTLSLATPLTNQAPQQMHVDGNRRRAFRPKKLSGMSILLIVLLVGCCVLPLAIFPGIRQMLFPFGPNAASVSTQLPTPLPVTSTTLYDTDWSRGVDNWTGGSEWKWIAKGLIGSDGNKSSYNLDTSAKRYRLLAPYRPATADYAIEAQVQLVRFTSTTQGDVGLLVRMDAQDNGYFCGFDVSQGIIIGQVKAGESPTTPISNGPNIPPDHSYHTIRVEVKKNTITLFIDKRQIAQTTDNSYLAPGMVGLRATNAVVDVSSFRVVKL